MRILTIKMAALDNFKNCSYLTVEQTKVIALVGGVSAAVCCAISSTVLAVFVILAILPKTRNRVCGTLLKHLLKRLSFGLIAVMVLYKLNYALQLVYYYHHDEEYCKVNGFFAQYFQSVGLLLVLGISVTLFFKIGEKLFPSWRLFHCCKKAREKMFTRHDMKISKQEVAIVATVIVLPLLFDWISFTTNSYGQYGTWCWIRILEQNCSTNSAGQWEKIWLMHVPFGIASFVMLVLFLGSLCQLGYGIKNASSYAHSSGSCRLFTSFNLLCLRICLNCSISHHFYLQRGASVYPLDFNGYDYSTHWNFCLTWSLSGYLSTHLCNLYIIPQVTSVPRDRQSSS